MFQHVSNLKPGILKGKYELFDIDIDQKHINIYITQQTLK